MARVRLIHGAEIEIPTADEIVRLLPQPQVENRIRVPANIALQTGSGAADVYKVPAQMEMEIRRVFMSLTGNAPNNDPNASAKVGLSPTTQTELDQAQAGANTSLQPQLGGSATAVTYCTGFEVTGEGATAASNILVTLSNTQAGTITYELAIPAGVNTSITPLIVQFARPLANVGGAAMVLTVPAFGAGNTNQAAAVHGYLQSSGGIFVNYLRSGLLLEHAQPQYGQSYQIPGVQTWGDEQGPYYRNGEVFGIQCGGLGNVNNLDVMMEGILRPISPSA